jgi:hypothetical protein
MPKKGANGGVRSLLTSAIVEAICSKTGVRQMGKETEDNLRRNPKFAFVKSDLTIRRGVVS